MNEERRSKKTTVGPVELAEHDLRGLLEEAGPRPEIPAEEMAAIKAAARAEWRKGVGEGGGSPSRGPRLALAIAAALLVAAGAAWIWRAAGPPTAAPPMVATVEVVRGPATAELVASEGAGVEAGDALLSGSTLRTAAGPQASRGLALRWAEGQSVRLDAATLVRLVDRRTLELLEGAVYVDSRGAEEKLAVRTPFGNVREIGTRFEVRLAGDGEPQGLSVRVRQGAIELRHGNRKDSAAAGEELAVAADGSLARGRVEPWDDTWSWAAALAPPLEVEDLRLTSFLAWATRETGWELRYEDDALAAAAAEIELHGSIEGLSPEEAVRVFLTGSGLDHRLEDGVLSVSR